VVALLTRRVPIPMEGQRWKTAKAYGFAA